MKIPVVVYHIIILFIVGSGVASDPAPLGRKEGLVFIACVMCLIKPTLLPKHVRMNHKLPTWPLSFLQNQLPALRIAVSP